MNGERDRPEPIDERFYLNGVGYKVGILLLLRNGWFAAGFIWTEWDIKWCSMIFASSSICRFIWMEWDIKGQQEVTQSDNVTGFIWTEWDIKGFSYPVKCQWFHCFIWTEWDIKRISRLGLLPTVEFYLNGVGYKARLMKSNFDFQILSFIWTEWDIKSWKIFDYFSVGNASFIWTEWDIKTVKPTDLMAWLVRFIWTEWDIKFK